MTHFTFTEEQLNYFKFTTVVLDEFPRALRNTFVALWDKKHGSVQKWDDSPIAIKMLQSLEKPTKTPIPSYPIKEWDSTALIQVTLYSRHLTDPHGNRLCNLVPKLPIASGNFHLSLIGCSQSETLALALDQLRRLRNTLCHQSSTTGIDQKSLQKYLQLAKDVFSTLGESTAVIDTIAGMTREGFPTDEVQKLEDRLKYEINANDSLLKKVDTVEERVDTVEEEMSKVKESVDQLLSGKLLLFKTSKRR